MGLCHIEPKIAPQFESQWGRGEADKSVGSSPVAQRLDPAGTPPPKVAHLLVLARWTFSRECFGPLQRELLQVDTLQSNHAR